MKNKICYLLLSLYILSVSKSFCQKKDSTWIGSLNGIVWDSSHNYVLRSATLAIYGAKNAELIGYRLSNNYGKFSFKGLPTNLPLKIVASFVGYKS